MVKNPPDPRPLAKVLKKRQLLASKAKQAGFLTEYAHHRDMLIWMRGRLEEIAENSSIQPK